MTYAKIDQGLTDTSAFRALSWDAAAVFFRILAHPLRKSFGLLRASPGSLEDDFEDAIPKAKIIDCLDELQAAGFLEWERGCIAISLQLLDKPGINAVRSWGRHLEEQRPCEVFDKRCRELAAYVHQRAHQEVSEDKTQLWLKDLAPQVSRYLDKVSPEADLMPSETASEMPSEMPSETASETASEMPLRDSYLLSLRSDLQRASDACARDEPSNDRDHHLSFVQAAIGRPPTARDLEDLNGLHRSWGPQMVRATAERVLSRMVAEGMSPTGLGVVRKALTDGDGVSSTSADEMDGYGDHLRMTLEDPPWPLSTHPYLDRLRGLVPLLKTADGLDGVATGINRWSAAVQERGAA